MATYLFKLPDIGEGIAEVELVGWHVKVGDTVAEDQPLADVMTDKATVEIPSPVVGKVVALGVASEQELEVLPGVQAVGATVPGYLMPSWFVIVAPAGTPAAITERLSTAIDNFEKNPSTIERFRALGAIPVGGPPERLATHLKAEQERYGKVLKEMQANGK